MKFIQHVIVAILYGYILMYYVNEIFPLSRADIPWEHDYFIFVGWLIISLFPITYIIFFTIYKDNK